MMTTDENGWPRLELWSEADDALAGVIWVDDLNGAVKANLDHRDFLYTVEDLEAVSRTYAALAAELRRRGMTAL